MSYGRKRMSRRKRTRTSKLAKAVARSVKRSLATKADTKALSYGFSAVGIGRSSGILGTGSLAMNDYLLNGGSEISVGTADYQRLGNRIKFKYLELDLLVTVPAGNGVRLIVGKSSLLSFGGTESTTNAILTGAIESSTLGVMNAVLQGGVPTGYFYQMLARPEKRSVTILKDSTFTAPEPAAQNTFLPIRMRVPLNHVQTYVGVTPTRGSFFIYLVAENTTTAVTVDGTIRAVWSE